MLYLFQLLSSPDVNWWTGVVWITCGLLWCFYQLFGLSFWRHPFTAEHPLLRQWCNDTFVQIWWRNKLLDGLRVSTLSVPFHFWVNCSLKFEALVNITNRSQEHSDSGLHLNRTECLIVKSQGHTSVLHHEMTHKTMRQFICNYRHKKHKRIFWRLTWTLFGTTRPP